ncbi:FkbM family methyltransferase [Parabacteroides sp. FAFU027]|uniref:FkbM family methyltransferase n=1 Tax=Parabacteroides sp. FAFU027 TaxID=2922715 RepID=UPI001FAF3F28|nr:FkbM family methyltransferase [Parabacteroides sp. FAFU027]
MDKILFIKKKIESLAFKAKTLGFGYMCDDSLNSLRRKMNLYFALFPKEKEKYKAELDFINAPGQKRVSYSTVFPYSFSEKYDYNQVEVFKDQELNLFYVIHNGKKLYFNHNFKNETAVKYNYAFLMAEQDKESTHCYLDDTFQIKEGDVILDIGAAEGNFSLDAVEKAKEIYIFEANEAWKEALEATFAPWKDKVHIYYKFVSNIDNEQCLRIDTLLKEKPVDFMKIDVEGAETMILEGAEETIRNNKALKLAICTYHQQKDVDFLSSLLHQMNFSTCLSDGYMLFIYRKLAPPYFRKGLIRATKKQ